MKPKLIFVVDDDRIIQNLLEYTFNSREGYDVMVFPCGEECIQCLNLKPDVIVLDHLFLRGEDVVMNGLDVLQAIRKKNKKVPVIILSNQPSQDLIDDFYKKGANGYIAKENYFVDTLIESIEEILA
ncbi:MAG TPA: response regulator [Bacteroidales bacterium]|nr:response regulator [Bacteroidales bacterium]